VPFTDSQSHLRRKLARRCGAERYQSRFFVGKGKFIVVESFGLEYVSNIPDFTEEQKSLLPASLENEVAENLDI